jgi:porin
MTRQLLSAAIAVLWAAFAASAVAQTAPTPTPQTGPPSDPSSEQPSQYSDYEYHSPIAQADTFRDKYFLGDWLGLRSKLADRGIRVALLYITDPFGDVTGGQQRGASDYSLVGFGIVLGTEPLLGWHGGSFHVGFALNFGTSLSQRYVGNGFPAQLADVADPHPRLTYLSYTQSVFEDKLSIRLGRVTINSVSDEEFLGSEYFKAFTSVGIDLVPLGIFLNAPGAFGYPDTTWGARIKFQPAKKFYTMIGAYNGDSRLKQGARHGVDFSMRGPLFLIGEFGFRRNYPQTFSGLPGNFKFGGYYNGGTSQTFLSGLNGQPSRAVQGRYGLYVVGDQVLVRWGHSAQDRRLGAFGAFTVAPDSRVNKVPYFFDTGLVMYGPFQRRPKDFAGFAVVYGSYSGDLRRAEMEAIPPTAVQQFEMALEWNYGLAIRPGLLLQPDVQYLVHPSGNTSIGNALAIGLNIVVNF